MWSEMGNSDLIQLGLALTLAAGLILVIFFREKQRRVIADREFLAFLHGATTAIALLEGDPGTTVLTINALCESMFKQTNQQVVGRDFRELIHQRNDALSTSELEFRLPGEDALLTVSATQAPVVFGGKKCRVIFLHDVSDRKALEMDLVESRNSLEEQVRERTLSLEESRSRLTMAVEHFSEGYALFDQDQKLILVNRRFRSILPEITHLITGHITAIDIWSAALKEGAIISPAEKNDELRAWFLGSTEKSISTIELSLSHDRWARCTIKNLPSGLQIITLTEVTELRLAVDAAEIAATSKANFLASMSHEIRTPLNGMLGMLDLLMRTSLDDNQGDMLRAAQDSGDSLLTIINDILDISKIEAGKLEFDPQPVDLLDLAESAATILSPNAKKNEQHLIVSGDPGLPEALLADGLRIRQILLNLLGNAIKFSPQGSDILLFVEMLKQRPGLDSTVRFVVQDQGIGISEEVQKNLFADFAQAESNISRRFGGTGLGLSICRRLTEIMDGSISVASTLGQGSTFTVEITFEESPSSVSNRPVTILKGVRVFILEENEALFKMEQRVLEHQGAQINRVSDIQDLKTQLTSRDAESLKPASDTVIVIGTTITRNLQEQWRHEIIQLVNGPLSFVLMGYGTRQRIRVSADGLVLIDSSPLRWRELVSAVTVSLGREVIAHDQSIAALEEFGGWVPPSVDEARENGELILVAEDNVINQQVIRRQLNGLGRACELAEDGLAAIEKLRSSQYALLLTDCDMPNMDGYELTRKVRSEESDAIHMPIVAITANAIDGAAEDCFKAGMDDYIAKPVQMAELHRVLETYMPRGAPVLLEDQEDPAEHEQGQGEDRVLDGSALAAIFGEDEQAIQELLEEFLVSGEETMTALSEAYDNESAEQVKACGHKLKSAARTVGAHILADLCEALEAAGREKDWAKINALVPDAITALNQVRDRV